MQSHAPRLRRGELEAMPPEARAKHLKEQSERYYNQRYTRRFPKETDPTKKRCTKCSEVREATLEWFVPAKNLKSGLGSWCRPCVNKRARDERVRQEYGITMEEYEAALADATCAICGTAEKLVLDHCHEMGTPRGVLCANCNTGLGMFCDDPHRMEMAASYIRKSLLLRSRI